MTPAEFKERLNKLRLLKDNGTYSFTEYSGHVDMLIDQLDHSKVKVSTEDFLLQIGDLIENGTVNYEMLERIKAILFRKNKPVIEQPVVRPKIIPAGTKPEVPVHQQEKPSEYLNNLHKHQITEKKSLIGVFIVSFLLLCLIVVIVWVIRENNSEREVISNSEFVNDKPAADRIRLWIIALGDQNFYTAYGMLKGSKWGTYNQFSSIKSFGGITSTKIWECYEVDRSSTRAEVYADYDSVNPYNKSGRLKQKFFLQRQGSEWYITDIKDIKN